MGNEALLILVWRVSGAGSVDFVVSSRYWNAEAGDKNQFLEISRVHEFLHCLVVQEGVFDGIHSERHDVV